MVMAGCIIVLILWYPTCLGLYHECKAQILFMILISIFTCCSEIIETVHFQNRKYYQFTEKGRQVLITKKLDAFLNSSHPNHWTKTPIECSKVQKRAKLAQLDINKAKTYTSSPFQRIQITSNSIAVVLVLLKATPWR